MNNNYHKEVRNAPRARNPCRTLKSKNKNAHDRHVIANCKRFITQ